MAKLPNAVHAVPGADLVWRLCRAAAWGTMLLGGGWYTKSMS